MIVHELSHALAGTVDIQLDEGVSVYGVENCKKLPKENPQLAIQNADNCEYFVESRGITPARGYCCLALRGEGISF